MGKVQSALVAVFVVVVGSWVGYSFWQAYQPKPLLLQGQIEAQQYNVSSKIAGRINELHVVKGQQVELDQLVFSLHTPELNAKLVQARAGQNAADAIADKARNGARHQEISAAKDQWQRAKVQTELLDKTYRRVDSLYRDGVLAEQKKDEVSAQLNAARHQRDAAFQLYSMAKAGARIEDQRAADGQAQMAAGAVDEVEVYVADKKVFSPHAGEVTGVLLHSGELAPQGFPVVTVMDMDDAWALFHVREDLLKSFTKGAEFQAHIPALDITQTFRVQYVSVMGDFATWRATNSESGFDMRTFEVEARPVVKIENLRAGMSIIVEAR